MHGRPSLRASLFLQWNRSLGRLAGVLEGGQRVVSELALLTFRGDLASAACVDHFNRARHYGSAQVQRWGLYPFELRMLERFPLPPARLLLHGCGGGRELLALLRAGYAVEAHEPARALAADAEKCVASETGNHLSVNRDDLQAWASVPSSCFDGAWVGWGAWAHILGHHERVVVLRALARAVPEGPILISFFRGDALFDHHEVLGQPRPLHEVAVGRLQRVTRHFLRERVLGVPPLERGTSWERGLYCHLTEEWELREEAAIAGCEVLFYEQDAARYPHAILRARRR